MTIMFSSCETPKAKLQFWPENAVRTKDSDYAVNGLSQIALLRNGSPENDAKTAFKKGDLRLIGDRPSLPRVFGAPDDALTEDNRRRFGVKTIAYTEELLESEDFNRLRLSYAERYNATIYDLIKTSQVKARNGTR